MKTLLLVKEHFSYLPWKRKFEDNGFADYIYVEALRPGGTFSLANFANKPLMVEVWDCEDAYFTGYHAELLAKLNVADPKFFDELEQIIDNWLEEWGELLGS